MKTELTKTDKWLAELFWDSPIGEEVLQPAFVVLAIWATSTALSIGVELYMCVL